MMTLIIGGSGSGKSAYAEKYVMALSKGKAEKNYYLATMQVFDCESRERILRHKRQRRGKGFLTIEQPTKIQNALEYMEVGEKTALLECISNLTANEMFAKEKPKAEEIVVEKIVNAAAVLKKELTHLVIVSNDVFEDGKVYDDATMAYIRAMGKINVRLAAMADEVVEVVVGIPVMIKSSERKD